MDYPVGLGGLDAEPALQEIVDEALEGAGRRYPWIRNAMGIGMCGPTLVARGTREQQERFLRPIFTAEEIWCQLFSEPGAGSDVAGLSTSAVRDGDQWIVNGSKIWTSQAHKASWGLLLARTDPDAPKHKGLTAFVVDMHEPGVEVRGIRSMAGASGFNEVFFTDSVVPDSMRVGEVGEGWRVGTATLMNERVSIGSEVAPRVRARSPGRCRRGPRRPTRVGHSVIASCSSGSTPRCCASGACGRRRSVRRACPVRRGRSSSSSRVACSPTWPSWSSTSWGRRGRCWPSRTPAIARRPVADGEIVDEREAGSNDPALSLCGAQAATIAGGTTQIQMNIIGERVLGLPREPGFDPDTPWSQIPRN